MFTEKKNSLFEVPSKKGKNAPTKGVSSSNAFVNAGLKKSAETLSGNGALKYSSSGNDFVNQFSSMSKYRAPRPFGDIAKDMATLVAINLRMAIAFVIFLRIITRVISLFNGLKTSVVQRGAGLKHESIVRFMWLGIYKRDVFYKNLHLLVSAGSWNDVIYMLQYDLIHNGWKDRALDWSFVGKFILAGLENPKTSNLVKKYLPQLKSRSNCKTVESQADNLIAKWICSLLFGEKESSYSYKKYRLLKTSGTAHEWQKLISKGKMLEIDFNTIHGRALSQLVSSKFLGKNGLIASYESWIATKPVAKFTGYVYELALKIKSGMAKYLSDTINAQFNMLVETARKNLASQGLRPISVMDCSGSMDSLMYIGNGEVGKLKSIQLAFSSAIFFNECMNTSSPFYNVYLSFSNKTEMHKFTGGNFVEKYTSSSRNGWGGTNFESVFDFFVDFRTNNPKVSEDLIPNFIVCFSDGEFNAVKGRIVTNVEAGRNKLRKVYSAEFAENFGICFIETPNTFYGRPNGQKFETFGNVKNVFYFAGYDLSPLAFLFGVEGQTSIPKTAEELFEASMNQEILNMIEI
jgi:hypothetical protein